MLPMYDWLHLHHEDFTGQYGKFYAAFKNPLGTENKKNLKQLQKNSDLIKFLKPN